MPFLGLCIQLLREAPGFMGSAVPTRKWHCLQHQPAPVGQTGIPGGFLTPKLTTGTWILGPVRLCFQIVHWPRFTHAGSGDFLLLEAVVLSCSFLGAGCSSWSQSRWISVLQVYIFQKLFSLKGIFFIELLLECIHFLRLVLVGFFLKNLVSVFNCCTFFLR